MDLPNEFEGDSKSISCGDDALQYTKVNCPSHRLRELHDVLRGLERIPTYLFPCTFEGDSTEVLMMKYSRGKNPLSNLVGKDLFLNVTIHGTKDKKGKEIQQRMYASDMCKRIILSIVRVVVEFYKTPFRPILEEQSMYVCSGDNIGFTSFQERRNQNWADETNAMSEFFRSFVKNRTSNTTATSEIHVFCDWLRNSSHAALQGNINSIFENVVFWDAKTRIFYLSLLHDHMESGTLIYPTCQNAFNSNLSSSTSTVVDPVQKIYDSNVPILKSWITKGDDDYDQKEKNWTEGTRFAPPDIRRSSLYGATPKDRLEQGLTRIRDSFRHVFQHTNERFLFERLQDMYQYIFPIHMIEFAKMQNTISFDAVGMVQSFLGHLQRCSIFSDHGLSSLFGPGVRF